jgi:hypothetical protein
MIGQLEEWPNVMFALRITLRDRDYLPVERHEHRVLSLSLRDALLLLLLCNNSPLRGLSDGAELRNRAVDDAQFMDDMHIMLHA